MHDDGQIELTESGLKKAQGVYERHSISPNFLVDSLKVDETIAEQDACRIEHILSAESFAKNQRLCQSAPNKFLTRPDFLSDSCKDEII